MTGLINFDQYGFIRNTFNWKRALFLISIAFLFLYGAYRILKSGKKEVLPNIAVIPEDGKPKIRF